MASSFWSLASDDTSWISVSEWVDSVESFAASGLEGSEAGSVFGTLAILVLCGLKAWCDGYQVNSFVRVV